MKKITPEYCVYVVKYNGEPIYVGRTTWMLSDRLAITLNKSRSKPGKCKLYNFIHGEIEKNPLNAFKFTIQRFSAVECSERHAFDYYTKQGYQLYQNRGATTTALCKNALPAYSPRAGHHLEEEDWIMSYDARVKMSQSAKLAWARMTPEERKARARKTVRTIKLQKMVATAMVQ